MCLTPILLPNPNYGMDPNKGLNFLHDTHSRYIEIPCGHCAACTANRQSAFVQRVIVESRYNHIFFCTLTYDDAHLPCLSVGVPTVLPDPLTESDPILPFDFYGDAENGDAVQERFFVPDEAQAQPEVEYRDLDLAFADWRHIQLLMKNLRDNFDFDGRSFKYVAVSELGKQSGRPHFHILFFLRKKPTDFDPNGTPIASVLRDLESRLYKAVFKYWAINKGTRKHPVYEPLFTYHRRWRNGKVYTNFDLHWVDPSLTQGNEQNVAFYVSKYIMKSSEKEEKRKSFLALNMPEDEFFSVWSIVKSRMSMSKGFGCDGVFETRISEREESLPLYEYSPLYDDYIRSLDGDMPDFDFLEKLGKRSIKLRSRILVPNESALAQIHKDVLSRSGELPYPVFIGPDGKYRPLSRYYYRFAQVFGPMEAISLWFDQRDPDAVRKHATAEDDYKERRKQQRRLNIAASHETFDSIAIDRLPMRFTSY